MNSLSDIGMPRFTVLCFIVFHRYCVFYKLKARPYTSKNITACFIAILTLLQWFGTESTISLRYACFAL